MTLCSRIVTLACCVHVIDAMIANRAEKIRNSLPLKARMKTPVFSRRHSMPDNILQENTDFANQQNKAAQNRQQAYGMSGEQPADENVMVNNNNSNAQGRRLKNFDFLRKKLQTRRHSFAGDSPLAASADLSPKSFVDVAPQQTGQFGQQTNNKTNNRSDFENENTHPNYFNDVVDGHVAEHSSADNSDASSVESLGSSSFDDLLNMRSLGFDSIFANFTSTSARAATPEDEHTNEEISSHSQHNDHDGNGNGGEKLGSATTAGAAATKNVKFLPVVDHVAAPNRKGQTKIKKKPLKSRSLEDKPTWSGGKGRKQPRKYAKHMQERLRVIMEDQKRYDDCKKSMKKSDNKSHLAGIVEPEKFETHNPTARLFESILSQDISGVRQAISQKADFFKMVRLAQREHKRHNSPAKTPYAPVEVLSWLLPLAASQLGPQPDGGGDAGSVARRQWNSHQKTILSLVNRIGRYNGVWNVMHEGKTALDWATEHGNGDLIGALESRGALSGDELQSTTQDDGLLAKIASFGSSAFSSLMGDGQDDTQLS